jgi:hypothetical protein
MGLEYITQPQVFVAGITALNGIQGGLEKYPLLTSFYSWKVTTTALSASFAIPAQAGTVLSASESFIVSVGGVVQSPTNYTVDPGLRLITLDTNVDPDIEISFTQLATHSPSSQEFNFLKTANASVLDTLTAATVKTTNVIAQNIISTSNDVFTFTTLKNLVSALAIQVKGTTLYLPLVSAI